MVKSSAYVRSSIRKYGGCLTVPEPLPCPLSFQIIEMKVLDPDELIGTNVDYNAYMCKDVFYQNSMSNNEATLNDWSQVVVFGRTEAGNSICVRIPFQPYVFLYAPNVDWSPTEQKALHGFISNGLNVEVGDIKLERSMMKRLDGWVPDPTCCTKTQELPVLRVSVPNKKLMKRLVDLLDPTKTYEYILNSKLTDVKDELLKMTHYKFSSKAKVEMFKKTLNGIDGQLRSLKQNIDKLRRDPEDVSQFLVATPLPTHFSFPPPPDDPKFQSSDLTRIWELWKDRYRLVHQHWDWWKQMAFKIKNIRSPVRTCLWETKVDVMHKFCDQTRIVTSGWMELLQYERPEGYLSHCQIECLARLPYIRPLDKPGIAPILMASVDGEMYSSNPKSFPNPLKPDNHVITIGVVLYRIQLDLLERFVFCLKSVDLTQITNATVFQFDDEQELLKKWRDFMAVEADPDFVTGYNILGFDWKYFAHRAAQTFANKDIIAKLTEELEDDEASDEDEDESVKKAPRLKKETNSSSSSSSHDDLLTTSSRTSIIGPCDTEVLNKFNSFREINGTVSRFFRLSRIWSEITPCRPQKFESNAYGERWSYHFDMTGRFTQDLLIYIRRGYKLESYKLNDVSFHFLKDNKIDLDHKTLFKYFEAGPKERGLIAEYCIKDCVLPIELCKHPKLMIVQNLIEMSRVTYTPLTQIINRGQQIKVFNQLVWYSHAGGFVMNDQPHRTVDGYEGATVLDPSPGWYDCPVTVLDFASLYPSVIINQNLCYSTIVREEKYANLPGVKYNVIVIGDRKHVFVQNSILKGVLPTLEESLLKARRSVKKQMKTEQDKNIYSMLDARQLAIKVSCNSVYGFTGAGNGMYPEPAIAESITATGRKYIDATREHILKTYPQSKVLYGDTDSVFIKFGVPSTKEGLKQSFDLGREAADAVSKSLGEAMSLEMEKVYFPLLLYGKKKYMGLKYENEHEFKELDTKGIEIVRRDWSALVRTIYKRCVDKVFFERDILGSKKLVQAYCQDMIDNKLDPQMFVISKELKSKYANPDSQVHVAVARKIAKRSPGSEPQTGDRVPFVIIRTEKKTKRTCEKSEDPEYAKANNIPLDYEYYLDKQLQRPLTDFFTMFQQSKDLFAEVRRQLHNQYAGVGRQGLMAYFQTNPEEEDELLVDCVEAEPLEQKTSSQPLPNGSKDVEHCLQPQSSPQPPSSSSQPPSSSSQPPSSSSQPPSSSQSSQLPFQPPSSQLPPPPPPVKVHSILDFMESMEMSPEELQRQSKRRSTAVTTSKRPSKKTKPSSSSSIQSTQSTLFDFM